MFKNLKLSVKISLGFAVILVIAMILGGVAVVEMNNGKNRAVTLDKQYITEIELANRIEQTALESVYAIRGYVYKGTQSDLDEGKSLLEDLKKEIADAKAFGVKYPSAVVLNENIGQLETKVNEYEYSITDTVVANKSIADGRKAMDDAAAQFVANAEDFLKDENAKLDEEIKAGIDAASLQRRVKKVSFANTVTDLGGQIRIANFKSQALGDVEIIQEAMKDFDTIEKTINDIRVITTQEINLQQLDAIESALTDYEDAINQFLSNKAEMEKLDADRGAIRADILEITETIASAARTVTSEMADETTTSLETASLIMIIGLGIALVLGIALAFIIVASITKPVNRIVGGLSEGAQQVAAASEQLSSSSQQLAEGSAEQASSIEETSSTLEESSSMVQQNTENTKQAAMLSKQAIGAAEKGNKEMKEMMVSMEELKKSSAQIGKIIKVIDEIAFQTNILALNAAVEAARAGDAGMGFAVVAEEVRNLAQRSAQAAKDTADIIERNISLSEQGADVSQRVNEALMEINLQSQKVNELLDEIAAASQEQSQGIGQINKAISQMEQVVQENAAGAEESASASEELSAQAQNMKDMVNELIHLVNGKAAAVQENVRQAAQNRKMIPSKSRAAQLKAPTGKVGVSKDTHIINPEEVIPLEDDMKDF